MITLTCTTLQIQLLFMYISIKTICHSVKNYKTCTSCMYCVVNDRCIIIVMLFSVCIYIHVVHVHFMCHERFFLFNNLLHFSSTYIYQHLAKINTNDVLRVDQRYYSMYYCILLHSLWNLINSFEHLSWVLFHQDNRTLVRVRNRAHISFFCKQSSGHVFVLNQMLVTISVQNQSVDRKISLIKKLYGILKWCKQKMAQALFTLIQRIVSSVSCL